MTHKYGDFGIRDGNERCESVHIGTERDSKKLLKYYFCFIIKLIILLFLFAMKLVV